MTPTARATVLVAAEQFEFQELALPAIADDDALLRVEACGLCGTDLEQYRGAYTTFPTIPGHETVGIVVEIGQVARKRWGVEAGDRIAVLPRFACGGCRACLTTDQQPCLKPGLYGFTSTSRAPSLWGGYAEFMYLAPGSAVRKFAPDISVDEVVLLNPLAAGYKWAVDVPKTGPGDHVLILGCGQRGLASLIAAREAGAEKVMITGLGRDSHKLELAADLGAEILSDADADEVEEFVLNVTSGEGARVVVDTTPHATRPITDAVRAASQNGIVVLAGLKGSRAIPNFLTDSIVHKELSIIGVRGADQDSFERAAQLIESRTVPFRRLRTHSFDLDQTQHALRLLDGEASDGHPINIALKPGSEDWQTSDLRRSD
jgi:threonine dehydrogenase-like Zn-dependent dehydrogenase